MPLLLSEPDAPWPLIAVSLVRAGCPMATPRIPDGVKKEI